MKSSTASPPQNLATKEYHFQSQLYGTSIPEARRGEEGELSRVGEYHESCSHSRTVFSGLTKLD